MKIEARNKFQAFILLFLLLITTPNHVYSMHLDEIENDKFLTVISNLNKDEKSILINILVNSNKIDNNKLSEIINIIKNNYENKITDEKEIKNISKNLNYHEKNRFLNMLIHFGAIKKNFFLNELKNIKQNVRTNINENNIDADKPLITVNKNGEVVKVVRNVNIKKFDLRRAQKVRTLTKKYERAKTHKDDNNNFEKGRASHSTQANETLNQTEEEYYLTNLFGNTEVITDEEVSNPRNSQTRSINIQAKSTKAKKQKKAKHPAIFQNNSHSINYNKESKIFWSTKSRIYLAVLTSAIGGILIYTYLFKKQENQTN